MIHKSMEGFAILKSEGRIAMVEMKRNNGSMHG